MGNIDKSKVTNQSYGNNWLVSKRDDGSLAFWAPSATATEEDVLDLMGKGRKLTTKQKETLRSQKFFEANDKNLDIILPDSALKMFEGLKYMDVESYERQYKTTGLQAARKQNRIKNGLVELLPHEQGELHERMTPSYMVMRDAFDFENDPSIMSQQTAMAIGIEIKDIDRSNREFERRIHKLNTARGKLKLLKLTHTTNKN